MFQNMKKTTTMMKSFLILSCCVLLGSGLPAPPAPPPAAAAQAKPQEIKLSQKPDGCDTAKDVMENRACQQYLMIKYGWESSPKPGMADLVSVEEHERNIRDFQKAYKLPETGIVDNATVKYLVGPRCGVQDQNLLQRNMKRRKRWTSNGSKWSLTSLSWCINRWDLSPDMDEDRQIEAIRSAFQMWADVSQLTFRQETDCQRAVINIKFAVRDHGDGDPFDGPDRTLAHAFFPRWGGDAHFDDDENWSLDTTRFNQKLFIPIATHEFGHSLGLGHSLDRDAIMYAYYFTTDPVVRLKEDDINGIQALYGKPITVPTRAPPTRAPPTRAPPTRAPPTRAPPTRAPTAAPTPAPTRAPTAAPTPRPPVTALCYDTPKKLDAMVMLGDGYTYGFSRDYYWRMDTSKALDQIPLEIRWRWFYYDNGFPRGLPGYLDAVLFWPNEGEKCDPRCRGDTFFFKGSDVYHLPNSDGTGGVVTKHQIADLFPGLEDNIDAATLWTGNSKAYFFKGNKYWRVSSRTAPHRVDYVTWPYNYPRPIDTYWDLGWQTVDSAIYYWHFDYPEVKKTYFFKEDWYVRYNDNEGTIDTNYPRLTDVNWYGCSANANMQVGDDKEQVNMDEIEDFEDPDVMDIEVIDVRTAMELPPEEHNSSSAHISQISLFAIAFYLSALVLL